MTNLREVSDRLFPIRRAAGAVLLSMLLVAATALVVTTKWTAPETNWGAPDALNVPLDSLVPLTGYILSPTTPCVDGNGNPVSHQAEVFGSLKKTAGALAKSNQNYVLTNTVPCNTQINLASGVTFDTELPNVQNPGRWFLRLGLTGHIGSGGTFGSEPFEIFLTRSDVTDIVCDSFDVENQDALCGGDLATVSYHLINYGELGALIQPTLYSAANKAMTEDLQFVTNLPIVSIPGGGGLDGYEFQAEFEFPIFVGTRRFALQFTDLFGQPAYQTYGWSQKEVIQMKADAKFVDGGWDWISPVDEPGTSVANVDAGGFMTFRVKCKNTGNAPTAASTILQVEIKPNNGVNGQYVPIPGAQIAIGPLPCKSGELTFPSVSGPPYKIVLQGELADEDDVGQKRAMRLVFKNTGPELALNNNNSVQKKIIVEAPEVTITGPARIASGGEVELVAEGGVEGASYVWSVVEGETLVTVTSGYGPTCTVTGIDTFSSGPVAICVAYLPPTGGTFEYGHTMTFTPHEAVELVYNAFIKCGMLRAELPFPLPPNVHYGIGDDRPFGFKFESSRIHRRELTTFDGTDLASSDSVIATSVVYEVAESAYVPPLDWEDVIDPDDYCDYLCQWGIAPDSVVICTEAGTNPPPPASSTVTNDPNGLRQVDVRIAGDSAFGCVPDWLQWIIDLLDEPIDISYDATVHIYQAQQGGIPTGPVYCHVTGNCDGFPWHEVFVNSYTGPIFDPCSWFFGGLQNLTPPLEYDIIWPGPTAQSPPVQIEWP